MSKSKDVKFQKASEAVEEFCKRRKKLSRDTELFEQDYPEAHDALQRLEELRESCHAAAAAAKSLVAKAGVSIGEFSFVQPHSTPGYDAKKLLELLCKLEWEPDKKSSDAEILAANNELTGEYLKALYERGVLIGFVVDKKAADLVRSAVPSLAEVIEDAWDTGGEPLTPRISVPKF